MTAFLRNFTLSTFNQRMIGLITGGLIFFLLTSCDLKKDKIGGEQSQLNRPVWPSYLDASYSEPSANPTTTGGIALGRDLFFEKALSLDYSISCASCHKPELAFADSTAFSMGIQQQRGKRNTPSILNAGLLKRLFWDGRDSSLESQSLHPITDPTEMGISKEEAVRRVTEIPGYTDKFRRAFGSPEINIGRIARAIAQYERSLTSTGSKYDRFLSGSYQPDAEELLGMQLFFTHPDPFAGPGGLRGGNCGDCHLPKTLLGDPFAFDGFHNTGLLNGTGNETGLMGFTGRASDYGRFKTPALRNVALTPPYMHDGRFKTLEQVMDHYNSDTIFTKPNVDVLIKKGSNEKFGTSLSLNDNEKKAIIRFLHMLTDSSAIQKR